MLSKSAYNPNNHARGEWPHNPTAFQWESPLPRFHRLRQEFPRPRVGDLAAAINQALDSAEGAARLGQGKRVAITAGSRGISHIPEILAAVVRRIRTYGGQPFLVPAMGSHGAATAEGQLALLANLRITQDSVDAPIHSAMEVIQLGQLSNGMPVYTDRTAAGADAVLVVNRIKPHTDFSGEFESGLAKMTAIGLGKQRGADTLHRYGVVGLRDLMPQAARLIVEKSPIVMGLAIIENAYEEIADITAVTPAGIAGAEESRLLMLARSLMPRLPFDQIDVLIVDEMGKNVSGAGMDSNILGRIKVHGVSEPGRPDIHTIVVLDVTPESHGNAVGLGLADVTTQRLLEKIDFEAMYINALTSGITGIQRAYLPVIAPHDRAAIMTALRACGRPDPENARIVRIKNTLSLESLDVSENLLNEGFAQNLSPLGLSFELPFDDQQRLQPFDKTV
jgi:hypothetical protein